MPHNIAKELKENMSTFKTKTIALMASSLIVAVAGLSFATTPAFAKTKNGPPYSKAEKPTAKPAATKNSGRAVGEKAPAKKKRYWPIR